MSALVGLPVVLLTFTLLPWGLRPALLLIGLIALARIVLLLLLWLRSLRRLLILSGGCAGLAFVVPVHTALLVILRRDIATEWIGGVLTVTEQVLRIRALRPLVGRFVVTLSAKRSERCLSSTNCEVFSLVHGGGRGFAPKADIQY